MPVFGGDFSRLGLAGSQSSLPPEQQQAAGSSLCQFTSGIVLHDVFLTSLSHRVRMISVIINEVSVILFI